MKNFWGKQIWAKRLDHASPTEIDSFLMNYTKYIPYKYRPKFPSHKTIEKGILATKNTAFGPDGIPFSLYRNLIDISVPIFEKVILLMATGRPPPKEFNLGLLCIFPKDNSSTIDRTRPITLGNTDNRIIAGIIAGVIMPAVDAIADKRQKGFIRGRIGGDNIRELTDLYYTKLNKQEQHYLLFIDTAKAFDSIDHDYLFAVLNKIGMPNWIINVIRGLMSNVRVRPKLPGRIRITIDIKRGVKQGCPLSPLLFILAYDPVLDIIGKIPGCIVWSFADDAVISHRSLDGLHKATQLIDTFSHISGFGVNRSKSSVLTVIEPGEDDIKSLESFGWSEGENKLCFTNKAVYLGVIVGYNIDNTDIYKKAYEEFVLRTNRFARALYHLSMQHKIYLFNIYVIPLFSYLSNFYLIPHRDYGKKVFTTMCRNILSFNGSAHKHIHLLTPKRLFGLHQPLRCVWATNVAALACQYDFSKLEGSSTAVAPGHLHVNDGGREWNGLLIGDHIACAALELVNDIIPNKDGRFDITPLDVSKFKHPKKKLRKICYNIALSWYERDMYEDIKTVLERRGMDTNPSKHLPPEENFALHGANILHTIPANIRHNHRKIVFNALATDRRIRHFITNPPRLPGPHQFPCHICGLGEDNILHIFGDCPAVTSARSTFGRIIGIHLKNDPKHYGLACKATRSGDPPSKDYDRLPRRTNATIIFNYAVWHNRSNFFITKRRILSTEEASNRIKDVALMLWRRYVPARWRPTHDNLPPDLAILDSTAYGSAGKRTPEQKVAAQQYGRSLIASIPPSHHIAYTDGSAQRGPKGKGGPCGAGLWLEGPSNSNGLRPGKDFLAPLGTGTNNIGELYAIGMAITTYVKSSQEGSILSILTDNKISKLIIEHDAKVTKNIKLVAAVRRVYHLARTKRSIRIHWLPAHVGIIGNENADSLADDGANISKRRGGYTPVALARRILLLNFDPEQQQQLQTPHRGTKPQPTEAPQDPTLLS